MTQSSPERPEKDGTIVKLKGGTLIGVWLKPIMIADKMLEDFCISHCPI